MKGMREPLDARISLVNWRVHAAVLSGYLAASALLLRRVLAQSGTMIAGDAGDPVLNASILWWNAVTVPFSTRWWNAPYFYLTQSVSSFTENLVGIAPIASPIYWMTEDPLRTYNLSFFLAWPLSAFSVYLLVRFLTRRSDAAFLAGLAYSFTPYRATALAHLQMLSSYYMPLVLLGLHGYVERRQRRWLVIFGAAWLLQSLANGYMMVLGAVLIGLWVFFFCSTRDGRRALPPIAVTWLIASLPLVPILLKYRAVHEYYGLRRNLLELSGFSYPAAAFGHTPSLVWVWHHVLPESQQNLFPGITAVVLVVAAIVSSLACRSGAAARPALRRLRLGLVVVGALSVAGFLYTIVNGPWSIEIAGTTVRASNVNRAVGLMLLSAIGIFALTPRLQSAVINRSAFAFYTSGALAMMLFSLGPVFLSSERLVVGTAPYRWLMYLPGFAEIREPSRFLMLGVLCLATAAGLAFAKLRPPSSSMTHALVAVVSIAVLLDGWVVVPLASAPTLWSAVEPRDQPPILELPLGPDYDAAATFRSISHQRGVINGVSGYDPAHYAPLQSGLNDRDPDMLRAIASFGVFDVVVDRANDPDGGWMRYATSVKGVEPIADDGARIAYRIPAAAALPPDLPLGPKLPIADIRAFRHDARVMVDGRVETEWGDNPQRPDQWVMVDLGQVRDVGGVSHALGEYARDFPRLLRIELSRDGTEWETAWQGSTVALAFRAAVVAPRGAWMRFAFAPQPARFVRLRQLAEHVNMWRIAELQIHGPPGDAARD